MFYIICFVNSIELCCKCTGVSFCLLKFGDNKYIEAEGLHYFRVNDYLLTIAPAFHLTVV
jgi:hypothetical protein